MTRDGRTWWLGCRVSHMNSRIQRPVVGSTTWKNSLGLSSTHLGLHTVALFKRAPVHGGDYLPSRQPPLLCSSCKSLVVVRLTHLLPFGIENERSRPVDPWLKPSHLAWKASIVTLGDQSTR